MADGRGITLPGRRVEAFGVEDGLARISAVRHLVDAIVEDEEKVALKQ